MHRHLDPSPFAPLPGMERAPRGLFLDRWGTLMALPERHGEGARLLERAATGRRLK